jgi:hypothetical protein
MPRTNWLLVNRLDLAAFFRSRLTAPANDEAMLYAAVTAPPEGAPQRIVPTSRPITFPICRRSRSPRSCRVATTASSTSPRGNKAAIRSTSWTGCSAR